MKTYKYKFLISFAGEFFLFCPTLICGGLKLSVSDKDFFFFFLRKSGVLLGGIHRRT